jgi:hypothetical protein
MASVETFNLNRRGLARRLRIAPPGFFNCVENAMELARLSWLL